MAAYLPRHGCEQVDLTHELRTVVGHSGTDHHAPDTANFLGEGPYVSLAVDVFVVVEVRQRARFQHQGDGEYSKRVLQRIDAAAEHTFQQCGILQPAEGQLRVYVADKEAPFEHSAVRTMCGHDGATAFLKALDLCTTAHLTPGSLDVADERIHNQVAAALQSPAALDVAAQAVGKVEQR